MCRTSTQRIHTSTNVEGYITVLLHYFNSCSCNKYHSYFQRIRHYMDWNTNCIQYLAMREVHSTFITEILKTAANFSKQDDGE